MPRLRGLALALALAAALAAPSAASATITVTSVADSGDHTLRQAIADAAPGETIVVPANDAPYQVTSSELQTTQDVTIQGAGARLTVIDASGGSNRVFDNSGGVVTISGVTITGGTADFGGGVRNQFGTLTLTSDTIEGNHATSGYAGVENFDTMTIQSSTIAKNVSDGQGGGLGNVSSSANMTIVNSTIAGNRAGPVGGTLGGNTTAGGGVEMGGASMHFRNSTIARNVAAGVGGGIHDGGNSGTDQHLINTIVAGNVSGDQGQNCAFLHPDNFHSDGHNVADDGSCNLDQTTDQVADPQLGFLHNNGGPTDTIAIRPESAAIDHGDSIFCPGSDQRGVHRPLDGEGDGHAVCDVGAFEAHAPKPHCSLDVASKRVFGHTFTDKKGRRHVKGAMSLNAQCDEAVRLRLTGVVVAKRKGHPKRTFTLAPITAQVARLAQKRLLPKLPRAALKMLRHGAHESASFKLTGSNANGVGVSHAAIDPIEFRP